MDDAILRSDLAVLEAVDGQVTLIEEKIAVIAAMLLMILTVVAGTIIYAYMTGYIGGGMVAPPASSMTVDMSSIYVANSGFLTAFVRNTGKAALTFGSVYIDGDSASPFYTDSDNKQIATGSVTGLYCSIPGYKPGVSYEVKVYSTDGSFVDFTVKGQ